MAGTAKTAPTADAEFSRALVRAMAVEGVFALIGAVAIVMTQEPLALIVPVVLGALGFLAIFLPAFKTWRGRQGAGGRSPIAQDGGF